MSLILPNGAQVQSTEPVTDYLYCGKCGIELPRPPVPLVGRVLPCPCCENPIKIARASEIWCTRVSELLVPQGIVHDVIEHMKGGR